MQLTNLLNKMSDDYLEEIKFKTPKCKERARIVGRVFMEKKILELYSDHLLRAADNGDQSHSRNPEEFLRKLLSEDDARLTRLVAGALSEAISFVCTDYLDDEEVGKIAQKRFTISKLIEFLSNPIVGGTIGLGIALALTYLGFVDDDFLTKLIEKVFDGTMK